MTGSANGDADRGGVTEIVVGRLVVVERVVRRFELVATLDGRLVDGASVDDPRTVVGATPPAAVDVCGTAPSESVPVSVDTGNRLMVCGTSTVDPTLLDDMEPEPGVPSWSGFDEYMSRQSRQEFSCATMRR